jgi:hypothetical protein
VWAFQLLTTDEKGDLKVMNKGKVVDCHYHKLRPGEVSEKDQHIKVKSAGGTFILWLADLDKGRNKFPTDRTTYNSSTQFASMYHNHVHCTDTVTNTKFITHCQTF